MTLGAEHKHDFFVSDGLFHTTTLVAFLGLLSLLVTATLTIKNYRLLGFGILWLFITISVTSSIITNTILVAEHRVYLPMIGLTFVIVGMCRYLKRPRIFWSLAIPIILILSVLTFMRNQVWKDDLTLWAHALEKSPNMSRPYVNYARALHGLGRLEKTIALYEKSLTMPASEPTATSDRLLSSVTWLAMASARAGKPGAAVDALMMDVRKNDYSLCGINKGGPAATYFPGNGGLLYAVAMMAAGWDGGCCESKS